MDTLNDNTSNVSINRSFRIRLAEAKKVAIEAALKNRQECLKAADLKHHPVSTEELISNTEVLKSLSNVNDQSIDVNNDPQSPVNAKPTTNLPFKLTTPYSTLKSARKRKRPTGIKKTASSISPSASKTLMESSASANRSTQSFTRPVKA